MGRLAAIALCVLLLGWHSERRVVILGDSIARGYGTAEMPATADRVPAAALRRDAYQAISRAKDGLLIAPVVPQVEGLPSGVLAFVHVGVNDVVTDNPAALADLDRLLAAIRSRQDVRFVVATIGPLGAHSTSARERLRQTMNRRIYGLDAPNVSVTPFNARHYLPDGMHPDWRGYDDAMPGIVAALKAIDRPTPLR